jgi:endonuclease/exonuclease/phosphatase family metal-dependent hydrolase
MPRRRSPPAPWLLLLVAAIVVIAALQRDGCSRAPNGGPPAPPPGATGSGTPGSYLFCFWNVENLFDDRADGRTQAGDKEFDTWFARDPDALALKLDHLSDALIKLNDGRGPDILAVAEVESIRAADLLREALNKRLADSNLHYQYLLMKELAAGRHIAPAILTRLPVQANQTRLHGRRQRILEGHIAVNGHDLVVITSHWTSRITDKDGKHRAAYGDEIYGLFRAMYRSNPAVDFLVCGDFNDPPDARSVTDHLHAIGDRERVLRSQDPPFLLNLLADKDRSRFGTHYHDGWFIFDQICISPGLLDQQAWSCDPDTLQVITTLSRPGDKLHRPWRFGSERDKFPRGYSDHFPVTVRLTVNGN